MATKAEEQISPSILTSPCPPLNISTNTITAYTETSRKHAPIITTISIYSEEALMYLTNIQLLNSATSLSKSIKNLYSSSVINALSTELLIEDMPSNLTLLSCGTCQAQFNTREEMVVHYREDWHRYNLRLSLAGKKPVREFEFESLLTDDISSISGSDGSSTDPEQDEITKRSPPQILFCSQHPWVVCSVYRELLHHRNHTPETKHALRQKIMDTPSSSLTAVIMLSAGHFAGAIFEGETVLYHKTFHRYVIRAKRGTVQSTFDNKAGTNARSVGAQIRRANEAALTLQIQQQLKDWAPQLRICGIIFIRWPVQQRQTLQADSDILYGFTKDDQRLRYIPIATRRPTFTETKRVHTLLTQLVVYGPLKDYYQQLEGTTLEDHPDPDLTRFMVDTTTQTEISDNIMEILLDSLNNPTSESNARKNANSESEQIKIKPKKSIKKNVKKPKPSTQTSLNDPISMLFREIMESCTNGQIQNTLSLLEKIGRPAIFTTTESCDKDRANQDDILIVDKTLNTNLNIADSQLIDIQDNFKKEQQLDVFSPAVFIDNDEVEDHINSAILVNEEDAIDLYDTAILIISQDETIEDTVTHEEADGTNMDSTDINEQVISKSPMPSIDTDIIVSAENVNYSDVTKENDRVAWHNLSESDKRRALNMSDQSGYTPLHMAAIRGYSPLIFHLLRYGANPSMKNKDGKVPFELARDKSSRDAFRRFMAANPDAMDYSQTKIPSPLTLEMEEEQRKKKNEKKKVKNTQRKQRKNQTRNECTSTNDCEDQVENAIEWSQLSDREKRALAAENRQSTQITQLMCSWCNKGIHGKNFFEKSSYIYCSIECVKSHRSYVIL